MNDAGIYYCEITNECGMVNTHVISLKVSKLNSVNEESYGEIYIYPNHDNSILFI